MADKNELEALKDLATALLKRLSEISGNIERVNNIQNTPVEPSKPALFDEAKEALENKLGQISDWMKGFKGDIPQHVKNILGKSLYLALKREVVAEAVNKAFPEKREIGSKRLFYITKWDGHSKYEIGMNEQTYHHLGELEFNNRQAAEAALALLQTELFEGDVTI